MLLGRNDRQALRPLAREPSANLAAHPTRFRDIEPSNNGVCWIPWPNAWDPSAHVRLVLAPRITEPFYEVLVFIPPREPQRVDVSHYAARGEPQVLHENAKKEQERNGRHLHWIPHVRVDAGCDQPSRWIERDGRAMSALDEFLHGRQS